ncbi:MAG: carboxypeptidase regulatory-like domain-containing protein, partial [Clostridiaceae bacterium]|nr:carboxypeptidase regulatory-like domain-containing protein [Clostridiaceae bacterium]
FQATTIPDGTYTIWNIPAGAGITVTANMDGYQASSTEVTVEAGKQTGDADFTLSDE